MFIPHTLRGVPNVLLIAPGAGERAAFLLENNQAKRRLLPCGHSSPQPVLDRSGCLAALLEANVL